MRNLAIFLVFAAIFLTACGESHTYSGVLKRTGLGGAEGKVNITVTKESESEATMTVKPDGVIDSELFLTECMYPVKLKRAIEIGISTWSAESCYLKNDSASLTGYLQIEGKQLEMKVTSELATPKETRFEFIGFEK